MPVEGSDAHANEARQFLDPNGFGAMLPNPTDRAANLRHATVRQTELADQRTLFAVEAASCV